MEDFDNVQQQEHTPSAAPPAPAFAPPPPPKAPEKKKGMGIFGILLILCTVVGAFLMIGICGILLLASFAPAGNTSGPLIEKEAIASSTNSRDAIAVISISGSIMGGGSHVNGAGMVFDVVRQLRQAADDSNVKAVILQIESPGGGLTASDIIYNEVKRVQQSGKKVVTWVGDMAASGGYYIAAPSDHIVTSPTGMVGSIGVIMMRFQVKELMSKLGIKSDPIKSTEMKDIGSPFRDLTPEEKKYFEDMLEKYHAMFVSVIAKGRNLTNEKVRTLANGKIYTAQEALEFGLIDEVGYFDAALEKAKEIAGTRSPRIIIYEKQFNLAELLSAKSSFSMENVSDMLKKAELESAPRMQAVWRGGCK